MRQKMQYSTIISSILRLLRTPKALVEVCKSAINRILCGFDFALERKQNIS
jgi:hypothetical protein